MKKISFWGNLALLTVCFTFVVACNNQPTEANSTEVQQTETLPSQTSNEQTTESTSEEDAIDKTGPEYTSDYICPMHCTGSGSDHEGQCPDCGMDYVKNEDK